MMADTKKVPAIIFLCYTKEMKLVFMGRTKGGINAFYAKEEKPALVLRNLVEKV